MLHVMETHGRVLLVGDTLVLDGLRAVLGAQPDLEVVTLGAAASDEAVRATGAATIICDRTSESLSRLLSITQERPEGLLIAVDPGSEYLLVVSNRQQRSLGLQELLGLIGSSNPPPPEGDHAKEHTP